MIRYVSGDATLPPTRPAIIAHVVNDVGAWGRGFVLAVSERWPAPEQAYQALHKARQLALGSVEFICVEPELWVANMCAQHGLRSAANPVPIRYDSLASCLAQVRSKAIWRSASVHMPRIGTGYAHGKWKQIAPIIEQELKDVEVVVYTLKE